MQDTERGAATAAQERMMCMHCIWCKREEKKKSNTDAFWAKLAWMRCVCVCGWGDALLFGYFASSAGSSREAHFWNNSSLSFDAPLFLFFCGEAITPQQICRCVDIQDICCCCCCKNGLSQRCLSVCWVPFLFSEGAPPPFFFPSSDPK